MSADCVISISAASPAPSPARPRQPAPVVALASYRRRLAGMERDRTLDAEWDRLAVLVAAALCWRDPESVEAVVACVARLEQLVREDWGAS